MIDLKGRLHRRIVAHRDHRRRIFVAVWVFAALLNMAALGLLLFSAFPGASVESWMSLTGSMIGSAITVLVAIGAIEWQRMRADTHRRTFLLEAINEPLEALLTLVERAERDPPPLPGKIQSSVKRIVADLEWLDQIMALQPPERMGTLRAYDQLRRIDSSERGELADAASALTVEKGAGHARLVRVAAAMIDRLTYAYHSA
jgi:hypothetical protein